MKKLLKYKNFLDDAKKQSDTIGYLHSFVNDNRYVYDCNEINFSDKMSVNFTLLFRYIKNEFFSNLKCIKRNITSINEQDGMFGFLIFFILFLMSLFGFVIFIPLMFLIIVSYLFLFLFIYSKKKLVLCNIYVRDCIDNLMKADKESIVLYSDLLNIIAFISKYLFKFVFICNKVARICKDFLIKINNIRYSVFVNFSRKIQKEDTNIKFQNISNDLKVKKDFVKTIVSVKSEEIKQKQAEKEAEIRRKLEEERELREQAEAEEQKKAQEKMEFESFKAWLDSKIKEKSHKKKKKTDENNNNESDETANTDGSTIINM